MKESKLVVLILLLVACNSKQQIEESELQSSATNKKDIHIINNNQNNISIKNDLIKLINGDEYIEPFVDDIDYENGYLYVNYNMEVLRESKVAFANGFNQILMVKRFCYAAYTLFHLNSNIENITLHVKYREGYHKYEFKSDIKRNEIENDINSKITESKSYSLALEKMKQRRFLKLFYDKYFIIKQY